MVVTNAFGHVVAGQRIDDAPADDDVLEAGIDTGGAIHLNGGVARVERAEGVEHNLVAAAGAAQPGYGVWPAIEIGGMRFEPADAVVHVGHGDRIAGSWRLAE